MGFVMRQLYCCYGPHYKTGVAHTIGVVKELTQIVENQPKPHGVCTTHFGKGVCNGEIINTVLMDPITKRE